MSAADCLPGMCKAPGLITCPENRKKDTKRLCLSVLRRDRGVGVPFPSVSTPHIQL